MSTNSALINELRQAVKDTNAGRQQRDDSVMAGILTRAQGFLNRELELCKKEISFNLVAGTRLYTADSSIVKFPSDRVKQRAGCVYWSDGNLSPISVARLDADEPGWRGAENGTPTRFFTQVAMSSSNSILQIGLDKAPDATFVADVPTLTAYAVVRPAAIAANTNYPFDNNRLFEDLDSLLIEWSIAEIERQDGNHEKADARLQKFVSYIDLAREWIPGETKSSDGFRFDSRWKTR